jgi:hypothetical protein
MDCTKMSKEQIVSTLRFRGVPIDENGNISRGSYSLTTWSLIDCLLHYHGGYRLV